jgi:hypothetical protein
MKIKNILLIMGFVAFSAATLAQPVHHNGNDRALNPQPLPPRDSVRDHRGNADDRALNPQPLPPRDFRVDRDHRRWSDNDYQENYRHHRDRRDEIAVGQWRREVFQHEWWQHPLYVKQRGPFTDYIYAEGRHGSCVLRFRNNRLVEIRC